MRKILVTGFDPFGGESINPAYEAVKLLPEQILDARVIPLEVPTVFDSGPKKVIEAVSELQPDFVLCIGQAGGRFGITPERVAINVDDARIPDNEGNQPVGTPIFADGDTAYFSSLPIKAMVQKMREAGIPAAVSNTAGTYVCNHLMYGVLYHIAKEFPNMRGGFVHVPFLHEQVIEKRDVPSLSKADIVKGLEAAIAAIAENDKDICSKVGGAEH